MKLDISDLTVQELTSLTEKANALIESKKDQEIAAALQEATAVAKKVGLSLEQLIASGSSKRTAKEKAPRKAVEPRYRNTDDASETWTGRGKQPRWLTAQLAQGKTLQDFLI